MLPLLKNALLTDDPDFQLLCSQNVCMYVGYVLNYYTTCAASHNSQREFTHEVFVCDKFNNMMNK